MTLAETTAAVESADSFEAAVAAALSEVGEATPAVEAPSLPDGPPDLIDEDDDAVEIEDTAADQAGEEEADEDFFGDEPKKATSKKPVTFEVPGIGEVPSDELVNGYLRQADYTQKTQQLAEMRRQLEERANSDTTGNAELWEALKEDPQGTIAYLATQVGLMNEEEAGGRVRKLANVKLRPESDVEQMVQERLAQALVQHPVMQEAIALKVDNRINSEFRSIEGRIGRTLSDRDRQKVMDFAFQNQLSNLEVAFDALMARSGKVFQKAEEPKAQTQKRTPASTGRPAPTSDEPVKDFAEAAQRAYAELEALNEV